MALPVSVSRTVGVLVADPNPRSRRTLRGLLEQDRRFAVLGEEADAPGAIAAAIRQRPDLCLLDVDLPGDGIAAAWEIAARLPRARLVMLAAKVDERDVFAALHAGAVGYLEKNLRSQRLVEALLDVVDGNTAIPRALMARVAEELRDPSSARESAEDSHRLTSREWQILSLLRDNWTTGEIATHLSLTHATVRGHRARVLRKLDTAGEVVALDFTARRRR